MASRKRVIPKGGRVTPKGGTAPSGRYTPPIPKSQKVSPPWVPAVMFTCLIVGMVIIIVNYTGVLPGGTDNKYLVLGLVLITGGFITATQYH
ncbi:MAG: hypothetical protein JWO37_307 [Acidimicrobiales bacterium]|jgi:hypothetical protein|nr:hypothetical protein [Acidimicrobiales bacterium]